jgi:hypothetical protein
MKGFQTSLVGVRDLETKLNTSSAAFGFTGRLERLR